MKKLVLEHVYFFSWLERHKELEALSAEEQIRIYLEKDAYKTYCTELEVDYDAFMTWKYKHPEVMSDDKKENVKIYKEMVRRHIKNKDLQDVRMICSEYGVDHRGYLGYLKVHNNLVTSLGYRSSAIRYCICNQLVLSKRLFPKLIGSTGEADFAQGVADYIVGKHMKATKINGKLIYCHCKHCGQDGGHDT